jgi:hypothetical protein
MTSVFMLSVVATKNNKINKLMRSELPRMKMLRFENNLAFLSTAEMDIKLAGQVSKTGDPQTSMVKQGVDLLKLF